MKPLRIHQLIGHEAAWTDDLWDEALEYLLERVGTFEAIQMSAALNEMTGRTGDAFFKIDYLRQFRDYPPTLLLGIFDLVRKRGLRGKGER